ncbi:phage tail protein [Macrococcus armenti]|uniref:phage tail protein n=1 Tax=Macrococcus armenti TaxID=2875764 RepID=UPI001CCB5EFB|nr:phage tail protein [Macrococcus armenti]UBH23295.1 phage tail protein [Macrococcus armenti]
MIIKLNNINIDFDLENEIPYFQVSDENKVRFDIDSLNKKDITSLINNIFKESTTNCSFLSEFIKPVKFKEKTNIGRYISINNWHETIHSENDTYVISTIKNITQKDINSYVLYIKRGLVEPFIVFYNDENMLYISNSVIDIISDSIEFISSVKDTFANHICVED